ncbi:hypothetical protein IM511_03740 [Erythrobacteraceae bacterium E2-1 Yellow Sea]|nr:hypothetical protein [Erythrobacteraceae bacterium E2-1 Yellow Sea]
MIATLMNLLFILAALATALTLADCWVRGRNAWRIARRELAQLDLAIAADLLVEQRLLETRMTRHASTSRPSGRNVNRARRLPRPALAVVRVDAA